MKGLFNALQTIKSYNYAPLERSIKEFEKFSGQTIPPEVIEKFKLSGFNNEDLFTSDYLNQFGLKNLLQLRVMHKKTNIVERIKTYSIDFIFSFIKNNPDAEFYIDEEGNRCKLRRAKIFYEKGINCTHKDCTLEGKYFALDKWTDGGFHFELYTEDYDGEELIITVDHIIPRAKGGKDHMDNYSPMCRICNHIKSDD